VRQGALAKGELSVWGTERYDSAELFEKATFSKNRTEKVLEAENEHETAIPV
jgi:hypothetical protein